MWLKSSLLLCVIAFALVKGDVINQSDQIGDEYLTYPSNELVVEEKVHREYKRDTASRNDPNQIQIVYDYLESGETRMKKDIRYEDVVLVLGNTGAGKSTIVQLLAGNNSNLISEKKCSVIRNKPGCNGDFKITDTNNKINSNVIYSHTEVPERVFDSNTNTVFYDCPGFSDNRDEKHDIGETYFIKKVTDSAKTVKFVFAVEYFAAIGMDEGNFMQLAKHATNLLQNITKFKDSIAMVATKVNDHQKTDQEIKFSIARYLDQVYLILKNKETSDATDKKIMQFIDILLTVDANNDYPRIGLFRQVTESGPLSNIIEVQKNKQFINNILLKNIKYIKHDNAHDFGYSISDNSKTYVNGLVEKINKNILVRAENIANKLTEYYKYLTEKMINKIESFIAADDNIIAISDTDYLFFTKFDTASHTISTLVNEINNVRTAEEFSNKISHSIDILNISISTSDSTSDILTQARYLDFFRDVAKFNTPLHQKELQSCFQSLIITLGYLKTHIAEEIKNNSMINNTESKIKSIFDDSGNEIQEYFSQKVETIEELNSTFIKIDSAYSRLSKSYSTAMNLPKTNEWIQTISRGIYDLNNMGINIISAGDKISNAAKYGYHLAFLHAVSNQPLRHPIEYTTGLSNVIEFLNSSQKWYQFLIRLYEKLSAFDIQSNISKCRELASKVDYRKLNGTISDIMLKPFLEKCYSGYGTEFKSIENITLTQTKLNTLRKVLHFTLTQTSVGSCDPESPNKLVIKGQYIKLSEINSFMYHQNCTRPLKFIEIFALKKVFIDTDFDNAGEKVQLSIIAPTWDIQGTRKIILDGKSGPAHTPQKAQNGLSPGMNGENGKHGLPGEPGGIFFGAGVEFINSPNLIITSNGGQGGPGQDGGDGMDGKDDIELDVDIKLVKRIDIPKNSCIALNWRQILYFKVPFEEKCEGVYKKEWPFILYKNNHQFPSAPQYSWTFSPSKKDGSGGNGGNGGNSGIGGEPGNVYLIDLLNNSTLNGTRHKGNMGLTGVGGAGGDGGKCGRTLKISYKFRILEILDDRKIEYIDYCSSTRHSRGTSGAAGHSSANIQHLPEAVKMSKPSNTINSYKKYARENLSDSIQKSYLENFLNLLLDY